jgi:hypothetical protein
MNDWQGRPKYSIKTWPIYTLFTIPGWPDRMKPWWEADD